MAIKVPQALKQPFKQVELIQVYRFLKSLGVDSIQYQGSPRFKALFGQVNQVKVFDDMSALIEQNVLNLLGVDGVMPHVFSEKITQLLKKKNAAMFEFIGLFHSHLCQLYLETVVHTDPILSQELKPQTSAFHVAMKHFFPFPLEVPLDRGLNYLGGFNRMRCRSPHLIKQAILHVTGMEAQLTTNILEQLPIEKVDQLRLGTKKLGTDTFLGVQVTTATLVHIDLVDKEATDYASCTQKVERAKHVISSLLPDGVNAKLLFRFCGKVSCNQGLSGLYLGSNTWLQKPSETSLTTQMVVSAIL